MPTIVHIEIPADDIERTKRFYSNLFGWKIEKVHGQDTEDNTFAIWEFDENAR